ncbi:MAG: hypothetical protein R6V62_10385 [Candidatus Fermentibacteraceae bacterium]
MPTWRPAAVSKKEFIKSACSNDYVPSLTASPPGGGPNPNLMCFINSGGLLGKGVCWWHSRFTRNALYLAYFMPERHRASKSRALQIIRSLMRAERVVAIPGYANLREFSGDRRAEIQKLLEWRQIFEGVVQFAWINGLAGSSKVSPERLKAIMDRIHAETSSKGAAYVKFQTPGLDAHALIVTGTDPVPEGGYTFRYLDSNLRLEAELLYRYGDRQLKLETGSVGVPHLQRSHELTRIRNAVQRFIETNSKQSAYTGGD